MIARLRFIFWLAIATILILILGDQRQQERYNGWLEERLRMTEATRRIALDDPEYLAERERESTEGCDLSLDEVDRLTVYAEFLERLP